MAQPKLMTATKFDSLPLNKLPIAQHIKGAVKNIKDPRSPGGGVENLNRLLVLAIYGGIGFGVWQLLPQIFSGIGQAVGIGAGLFALAAMIIMFPVFIKGCRKLATVIHRAFVKWDPFGTLNEQLVEMRGQKKKFKDAKVQMLSLEQDARNDMNLSKKNAEELQARIQQGVVELKTIRTRKADLERTKQTRTDEYKRLHRNETKLALSFARLESQFASANSFIQRHGGRWHVFQKVNHKIDMSEIILDNKIKDFESTIEILEKEYAFAAKSAAASSIVKDSLLFETKEDIDLALSVITSSISYDLNQTAENFKDLDNITSGGASMDTDAIFNRLDKLDKSWAAGEGINSTDNYGNPGTYLSRDEKDAIGPLGSVDDLFDD